MGLLLHVKHGAKLEVLSGHSFLATWKVHELGLPRWITILVFPQSKRFRGGCYLWHPTGMRFRLGFLGHRERCGVRWDLPPVGVRACRGGLSDLGGVGSSKTVQAVGSDGTDASWPFQP